MAVLFNSLPAVLSFEGDSDRVITYKVSAVPLAVDKASGLSEKGSGMPGGCQQQASGSVDSQSSEGAGPVQGGHKYLTYNCAGYLWICRGWQDQPTRRR